jgi:ribosome-binding protein aMBF1 (putative translation factor)
MLIYVLTSSQALCSEKSLRFDPEDFCSIVRIDVLTPELRRIDVAKKMKRPQSYISRVESGEYRLDILEVKRFAQLYKKSIEYFVK